ncbi:Six-hairpin glycosidase [Aspergillus insuetus]
MHLKLFFPPRLLVCVLCFVSCCIGLTRPISFSANGNDFMVSDRNIITLSSDGGRPSVVVLDYGRNVEGYPTFKVVRRTGDTSAFETSYAECQSSFDSYMSDGPITLSATMDNYRVNRYNITGISSIYTNRLIQGGLRYQKLNLSTAGELILANVGFLPTLDDTPITKLPGAFRASDPVLTRIWEVGARTVQLNEFPAKSLPELWTITDEGALIESQAPQPFSSDYAPGMMAYDLQFAVKTIRSGFGFTVLSDTLGSGVYIFVNIADGSISAHGGATELDSQPLARAVLPPSVAVGRWLQVSSTVDAGRVQVSFDGSQLLNFTQGHSVMGSFGLGASFNHAAVFTNVSLTAFGTTMYSSKLNDKSALEDFLLGTNPLPVSVDGSRRDRIAYAGDLDIAAASAFASTAGHEYVNGSISLLGSFQMLPGFFIPTAKVQQTPRTIDIAANITGLIGYSFNLVSAMSRYYQQTGDKVFLSQWAPNAVRLLNWAHSQLLPSTGLLNISNPAMGGDWNYYDPQVGGVVAKFNLVYAYALAESMPFLADAGINATTYTRRLRGLKAAINKHLWSDDLQAYYHSESYPGFISQEANALAILSDTIPTDSGNRSATGLLASMSRTLNVPAGVLAFSPSAASSGWEKKISPYASGYHLKAALHAKDGATARHLLDTVWAPMSDPQNANYTGCFWEVLSEDGTPGLGVGTSLCHAYVLGIAPVTPGFREWKVKPQTLDLDWAEGRHPVPQGAIGVQWRFDNAELLKMTVTSPHGTNGTVHLPAPLKRPIKNFRAHGRTFVYQQIA